MNPLYHRCDNGSDDLRHIESFEAGDSDDLATENASERANQALMKFLDERSQQAQPGKGTSLEKVRRQLGL